MKYYRPRRSKFMTDSERANRAVEKLCRGHLRATEEYLRSSENDRVERIFHMPRCVYVLARDYSNRDLHHIDVYRGSEYPAGFGSAEKTHLVRYNVTTRTLENAVFRQKLLEY